MSTEHPRIVVIGSSNTDLVVNTPRLPRPGETMVGGDVMMNPGGKGANQAAAAARLGAAVHFVGRLGIDSFGEHSVEILENSGIDLSLVIHDPLVPSGVALITVAPDGSNQIVVAPGANAHLSPADVERARDAIGAADLVILQFEIPLATVQRAIEIAAEEGTPVILNPAPVLAERLPPTLYRQIAMLVPNEVEAGQLLGRPVTPGPAAESAALELLGWGVEIAVITLGAQGVIAADGKGLVYQPPFPVQAIDTTAAGDCFIGALAFRHATGQPLVESLRFASAAAALSVTRAGAQQSLPFLHEVELMMETLPSPLAATPDSQANR